MNTRGLTILFETILQQLSPEMEIKMKPDSATILEFLNLGLDKYVEAVYGEFEQTQLFTDNLKALVEEVQIATAINPGPGNKPNSYTAALPDNYLHAVGEEVNIDYLDFQGSPASKRVGVTESTSDTYTRQVSDPYSEHRLHYETAKPLRLFRDGVVDLITDGNYDLNGYNLRYIKIPERITLGDPDVENELPLNAQKDFVELSVRLYISTFGGSKEGDKQ